MNTRKITAGLAQYDGPSRKSLADFKTGPKSLSELIATAHNIDGKKAAFSKRVEAIAGDVLRHAAEVREKWANVEGLSKGQREALAAKEISKFRREVSQNTEAERYQTLRELRDAAAQVEQMAALYESSSHILARDSLGSEERSRYQDQIANSGPLELANFAALAVSTNNRVLGAALLSRLDSLPADVKKNVDVSRQELADCLCGEEFAKANESITIARNRIREAINQNRDFESGRQFNGTMRLSEGLARQKETGALNEDSGDE
jgi:hypothetical protein